MVKVSVIYAFLIYCVKPWRSPYKSHVRAVSAVSRSGCHNKLWSLRYDFLTTSNLAYVYHGASLSQHRIPNNCLTPHETSKGATWPISASDGTAGPPKTRNLSSCTPNFKDTVTGLFDKCGGKGPLLEVRNASIWLEDRVLFDEVEFTVNKAECVGIVGNNGNGKTSLLDAIYQKLVGEEPQITALSTSMDLRFYGEFGTFERSSLPIYQLLHYMKIRGYKLRDISQISLQALATSDDYTRFLEEESVFSKHTDICSDVAYMRQNYVTCMDGSVTVQQAIDAINRIHHVKLGIINDIENCLEDINIVAASLSEEDSQDSTMEAPLMAENVEWAKRILTVYNHDNELIRRKNKNIDIVANTLIDMFGMRSVLDSKVSELSGGFKMRQYLLCSLLNGPKLLLLDEPTNNLDVGTVRFLSKSLRRLLETHGLSIIVVSHDKSFLNELCNVIFEVTGDGSLSRYAGNFDSFMDNGSKKLLTREVRLQKLRSTLNKLKQQYQETIESTKGSDKQRKIILSQKRKLIQETEEKIDDLKGGEKNSYSAAYEKAILLKSNHLDLRRFLHLPLIKQGNLMQTDEQAFMLRNAVIANKENEILLSSLSLNIYFGERIVLLGNNGSGKSTLLSLLEYAARAASIGNDLASFPNPGCYFQLIGGEYKVDKRARINYFSQNCSDLLKSQLTVAELAMKFAGIDPSQLQELTKYLTAFHLKDVIDTGACHLSFGERSRLMLALQFLRDSNFLFLDEPSNHLDLYMQAILPQLLNEAYTKGGYIIATHDLQLLRNLDRITALVYILDTDQIYTFNGDFKDEYIKFRTQEPDATQELVSEFLKRSRVGYRRRTMPPSTYVAARETERIYQKKKQNEKTVTPKMRARSKPSIKNARRYS